MSEPEQHAFKAEVNEVLSIVVNSLYSHPEVFLRELVSNASDALDRLSFRSLTEHDLLGDDTELRVDMFSDEAAGTLTIRDNGVGMTKEDLESNLGTIARSGSKHLMKSLSGEKSADLSLIGQFGVGFYSSFLVADRVTVVSRAAGADESWEWQSEGKGSYTIRAADQQRRGTDVVLHMKPDATEHLQEGKIRTLVSKYSDYVRYPIRLMVVREKGEGDDKKVVQEWETINRASALWTRPRSEITGEQYREFYKHLGHDWEPPLAHTHFKIEGTQELTGLLFLPRRPPFDLFEPQPRGVKLFVKRVFVMDECEELVPQWLRFLRGVIDSEDLPLNVSRELLQKDQVSQFIRKQIVSRSLTLLEQLAGEGEIPEKDAGGDSESEKPVNRYQIFWQTFGAVLKEGVHFEPEHRKKIAGLLRYESSREEGLTSLADYVSRMSEDQQAIYYLTAVSTESAAKSPHIEALVNRGFEVLFMPDSVDEWVVEALGEFEGVKLVSAAKGSLDLPESGPEKEQKEERSSRFADLLGVVQSTLEERVSEVRLTDRLTDSPACLVTEAHGLSPHVERMLRASGQEVPLQKRILELNPDHVVVQNLQAMAESGSESVGEWSNLLYDQALLAEGSMPRDPAGFARSVAKLMEKR
jgi:molecular chaperone HtpG